MHVLVTPVHISAYDEVLLITKI